MSAIDSRGIHANSSGAIWDQILRGLGFEWRRKHKFRIFDIEPLGKPREFLIDKPLHYIDSPRSLNISVVNGVYATKPRMRVDRLSHK